MRGLLSRPSNRQRRDESWRKAKAKSRCMRVFFLIICEIFGRADGDEEKEVKADGDRSQ